MRIVGIDDGADVPAGAPGEIAIAGPMVVPGYWNAPDESRLAIKEGWLFTGDVGIMNADGWLFVIDRKKDLINAGGYKIWPREVEDVLSRHPRVREAVVVGIPDEYRGETVKAYVSLTAGPDITASELIDFCRHRLSAYKYPRSVEIVADIPKAASGKLMRRALRGASGRPLTEHQAGQCSGLRPGWRDHARPTTPADGAHRLAPSGTARLLPALVSSGT